jgi:hypothetical protein
VFDFCGTWCESQRLHENGGQVLNSTSAQSYSVTGKSPGTYSYVLEQCRLEYIPYPVDTWIGPICNTQTHGVTVYGNASQAIHTLTANPVLEWPSNGQCQPGLSALSVDGTPTLCANEKKFVYSEDVLLPNSFSPAAVAVPAIIATGIIGIYCVLDTTWESGGVCATLKELAALVLAPDGTLRDEQDLATVLQSVILSKRQLTIKYVEDLHRADPNDDCERITIIAVFKRDMLELRHTAMRQDEHNLYNDARFTNPGGALAGYGTWITHRDQYNDLQDGLRSTITLAHNHVPACILPEDVYLWANTPPPSYPD